MSDDNDLIRRGDIVPALSQHFGGRAMVKAVSAIPASPALQEARDKIAALEAENADLKQSCIAFCGPWAAAYAERFGFPDGHLHPTHYDILAKCGARMDAFTRANINDPT